MRRILYFGLLLLLSAAVSNAQEVNIHLSNTDLYDYLDELANRGVIQLNSAVKPYSRSLVAEKLKEADAKRSELNNRQQKELDFYKKEYVREIPAGKDRVSQLEWVGYFYQDSLFTAKASPIVGMNFFVNDSDNFYRRYGGIEGWGAVGSHFSFYASLRDHHESSRLSSPDYLNQFHASNYKVDDEGGGDYDEPRGGVSYAWKWGSVGVFMDQIAWGDNYNGANILGGHNPVYASIQFRMKPVRWFDFHYFHGWLKSDVIDSVNMYSNGNTTRLLLRPKYIASNLFTFTPVPKLQFSIGNSIVYSDGNVHPVYFIPFLFYKSVDRSLNGYSSYGNQLGQNSQLFFNLSSRNIRNVHLYSSLFIDEMALGDVFDEEKQSNFLSFKLGGRVSNLFVENLFLTAEYTVTRPVTYRHYIATADFATSSFNMGHYLGDNSQEIYLALGAKPIPRLWVEASYTMAQKGEEYPYTGQSGTSTSGKGLPFMENVMWEMSDINLKGRYQIVSNAWVFAGLALTDHSGVMDDVYSQPLYRGSKTTINVGANIGF